MQSRNGDNISANPVSRSDNSKDISTENTKSVKNTANRFAENMQLYRKMGNKSHDTEHQPENTVQESEGLEEKQDTAHFEQLEYSEEQENVPPEHLEEKPEKPQGSSYLGNSEHAVFDTYNGDVRAYKVKNAYEKYIQKQKNSRLDFFAKTAQMVGEISRGDVGEVITDTVIGSVTGERTQNAINGVETVSQAVSGSDSVGGAVLDVSATLAAVEAKKMVKKLAETDFKKKQRVDERMKNHGYRFGIDKYDEVTGKNEKSKDTKENADRHFETADKKQGSAKVGSSNKLRKEKQEYAKVQRAKEIRGRQKEIFIKENQQ